MFGIITFILVLSLLVFVHELGHFLTARRAGVKVEEFGFGFPPRLFGVSKINGRVRRIGRQLKTSETTIYSINWIPLGGFVKIKGEQGDATDSRDSFAHKSALTRAIILSAGVGMNIILALILLAWGFMLGLPQILPAVLPDNALVKNVQIQITEVLPELPGAESDLKIGDTIVSLDRQKFDTLIAVQNYLGQKTNQPVELVIKRLDQTLTKTVTPVFLQQTQRGGLGVALVLTGHVSYPWYQAVLEGFRATWHILSQIVWAFYDIIRTLLIGQKPSLEVAGPVGIAALTSQVSKLGFVYVLQFTAILSLNLAVINFLPIPALDGGRLLFLAIEKIRGRPVKHQTEAVIHNVAFALLLILILIITFRDIFRLTNLPGAF